VCHIVGDLFHFPYQRFDAVEHQIEVLGELIPFVSRIAQGYSLAKAALHGGPAGRINCFDPSHCAPCDGNAGHTCQQEYQRDAPEEGHLDLRCELIEIVDVFSDQQMVAVGKRFERRSQQWPIRLSLRRVEIVLSICAF
jgi:hypothetical protein